MRQSYRSSRRLFGGYKLNLFRPISLCSTIYKVIARAMKKKLQLVVEDIVQRNQVGFIQKRLLCENVLLASELVTDFPKEGETRRGCLKIDLSKACTGSLCLLDGSRNVLLLQHTR